MTILSAIVWLAALTAEESSVTTQTNDREARIEAAFNDLNKETVDELDTFYADSVLFEDPLGRIQGLDALKQYYAKLYESVTEIAFEFETHIAEGNTHVAVWIMRLKAKGLNRGEEITVHGNSVLRFDANDKVVYHRDYFDMGEMVYQHVPLVGFVINRINKRLAHEGQEN